MTPQAALVLSMMLADCPYCRGDGVTVTGDVMRTCFPCVGTGTLVTDVGMEVVRKLGERARHIETMTQGHRAP